MNIYQNLKITSLHIINFFFYFFIFSISHINFLKMKIDRITYKKNLKLFYLPYFRRIFNAFFLNRHNLANFHYFEYKYIL